MDSIEKILHTYHGAFAIIDILGYIDKLHKFTIEQIKENIIDKIISIIEASNSTVNRDRLRFNKFANNKTIHTTSIDYLFYSDSILLFVETDDDSIINTPEYSINSLCYALSIIMGKALEENIPLRGAISFGEVFIQRDPVIIIGKPMYDISILEKSQNWAGIVLAEVLNQYDLIDSFIIKYRVPIKHIKEPKEMFAINWTRYISRPDFNLCFDSSCKDVIEKKDNTIKFYDFAIQKSESNPE